MYINGEGHRGAAPAGRAHRRRQRRVLPPLRRRGRRRHPRHDALPGDRRGARRQHQGEIDALNRLVDLAIPSIPSRVAGRRHLRDPRPWALCDQLDVVDYRDMVTIIRDRIRAMVKQGKTLEQVKAASPTQGYNSRLRFGFRSVDDEHVRRGGLQEPDAKQALRKVRPARARGRTGCRSRLARRNVRRTARWSARRSASSAKGRRADRSDGLLGVRRHRRLALPHGDAGQGRLPGRADDARGAQGCGRVGSGRRRSRGQPVQELRRRGDHARARTRPYHLAGRQDPARRNRRRHADSALSL